MNGNGKKPARTPLISTGVTSMVLVFVMLCLLTFAVLSLVSARADLRLSQKSAERTTAYYAAENAANDVLIGLDDILRQKWAGALDAPAYYAAVREAAQDTLGVTFRDDTHLAWQVPLGEDQALQVEVEIAWQPFADGRRYRILAWQAAQQYAWNEERPLQLMHPGEALAG